MMTSRLVYGLSHLSNSAMSSGVDMVSGSGVFVFDSSGKDYIDAVSALFCATLGFHNERLIEAATRQMRELPVYPTALNRTVPVVHALADALSAAAPIPDAHVLFATSGSEAIETLIKTTWYINKQRNPKRHKIITRRGSYHGSTIFATRLGGIESIINSFDLTGDDILYAAQPRWPRDALAGETEEDYAHRLALELAELIDHTGAENIAAFLCEPVSIAGGMYPAPEGYFEAIRNVLSMRDIPLYFDEIVTGFGRTGKMWGSQTVNQTPDCLVASKGLSAAYQPISAVVMNDDFHSALVDCSIMHHGFHHGGTYHAHPVAAAVALETLKIYEDERIVDHVRDISEHWIKMISKLAAHELVRSTRTIGLLSAIEVGFRSYRELDFRNDEKRDIKRSVVKACMEHGVLIRISHDSIILAPPLIISKKDIDELEQRMTKAFNTILFSTA